MNISKKKKFKYSTILGQSLIFVVSFVNIEIILLPKKKLTKKEKNIVKSIKIPRCIQNLKNITQRI